ncbi:hypothetical protein ACEYYA_00410 [Paracoccus sp. p3-h83]|uniref:hypothetical protein n=1 Tax=Paracoccus sp. p3-h83 TaxID=3342805 RepID=UPI0035B70D8E
MIGVQVDLTRRGRGAPQPVPQPVPDDPFPADLMAQGGTFHHWAVEEAGATWATRHGAARALSAVGQPGRITRGGVSFVDCAAGCYDHVAATPPIAWAPPVAWSIWLLTDGQRSAAVNLYHGPMVGGANTSSTATVYAATQARLFLGNPGYNAQWALPTAGGAESLEWDLPGGTGAALAGITAWRNGVAMARSYLNNRGLSEAGPVLVLGGARNASGVSVPGGLRIRDVVMTVGWTLGPAQRAALESYRLARLAA